MATSDYRMSLYLGDSKEGADLKDKIVEHVKSDVRFKDSEAEFVRYCIRYTLANDGSLVHA